MAGLLATKEERLKPHEDDLLTRSLVAAGEQAVYDDNVGPQLMQMVQGGSDPETGVGLALTVLLSNVRNSFVESSGKGIPMDVLFMKKGAAPILAQCIADYAGIPEAARGAVPVAQQMIMNTDQAAHQAAQGGAQQGQPQGDPPQTGMTQGTPQGAPPTQQPGLLGGM